MHFLRGCAILLYTDECISPHAIVAQLDRAFGSDPEGQRFESSRSHQEKPRHNVPGLFFFVRPGGSEQHGPAKRGEQSTDQLTTLLDASTQIQNGIARLDAGAAQLDEQVSYDAYKAILKENGLDLDQLKDGNAKAMEQLEQLAKVMPQLKDVILLLKGSSANIDAMETYLNTVHDGVAQLHAGSSTLNSQYGQFDAGVRQLANALTGMLGNLSVLTDGVNQLASQYGQLDSGLNAYTDGVAQLKAGVQQLTDGAAQLTAGTGELRSNVSGIDMGDQLDSLLAGLNGSSEVESFTSAENTDVSAVQFALQTVAIEAPAPAAEPEAAPVALTFWQKLLKLFGLYKG